MNLTNHLPLRSACLLASAALVFGGAATRAADKAASGDAFPTFESYIKITGQAASISGDEAAFQTRTRQPKSGGAGIEDMHYARDLKDGVSVQFDGRALAGSEDYLGQFKLAKEEVGSVEVGYKRFRTFYDGIGGFFPRSSLWLPLTKEDLHTDRAKFWTDILVNRPNAPIFHVRYTNELRDGRKDSTIWGDSDLTGIPIWSQSSLNPISANRKLVASYIDLNERQQNLEATISHTIGNTRIDAGFIGNRVDMLNTRWLNRYPGELKPYPAIPSTPATLVPAEKANNATYGFDQQGNEGDSYTLFGKFETTIDEMFTAFGGVSYVRYNGDIMGDREIRTNFITTAGMVNPVGGFTSGGRPPYSYVTTAGHMHKEELTANVGLNYQPKPDMLWTFSVKTEDAYTKGYNNVNYLNTLIVQNTGALTPVTVVAPNNSQINESAWQPEVDFRYSGFKNLSLFATAGYRMTPRYDERTYNTGISPSGTTQLQSISSGSDNIRENHGNYKLGANWKVANDLTFRVETYLKDHRNDFNGYGASYGSRYVLDYKLYGAKISAIFKPIATVTLTTRYVGQRGLMSTTVDAGESYNSGDYSSHNLGETIDWVPNQAVYFQASANVVFDTLQTAYPRAGGAANDVLRNANNDYVDGSFLAGLVLGKRTDAQLQYTWYRASNYDPGIPASLGYGMSVKDDTVTVAVKHKLTDSLVGVLKFGYFDSNSDTTGGRTNYHGPLVLVSLDYAL
jgi:hypothetical protein